LLSSKHYSTPCTQLHGARKHQSHHCHGYY
jgi:hypothetical protein